MTMMMKSCVGRRVACDDRKGEGKIKLCSLRYERNFVRGSKLSKNDDEKKKMVHTQGRHNRR